MKSSRRARSFVKSLAREPLVHFVVLGALVFAVYGGLGSDAERGGERAAPGASSSDLVVTTAEVNRLRDEFRRAAARPPTRDELAELVFEHVGEELLFREAVAAGADRTDPIARRCLVDRAVAMTAATSAAGSAPQPEEPGEDELRAWFERRRHRFVIPERVSFEHVFVNPDRHGAAVNQVAATWLARLRDGSMDSGGDAAAGSTVGDPSPIPRVQSGRTRTEVAHLFGEGFASALPAAERDRWTGPLSSRRGLHLVRLTEVRPARIPELDEVRADVRADWLTVKRRGVHDAAERLLARTRVHLPDNVARELQGSPVAAGLLPSPAAEKR